MHPTLFFQSEIKNPYLLYETMLKENPVYWDEISQLWAVYSFSACESVLKNTGAYVPVINPDNKDGLNEYALLITKHVARLNNAVEHTIAREIAMLLFQKIKEISIGDIIDRLLQNHNCPGEMDFVSIICKKLPVRVILKSFDFNEEDVDFISGNMESFVKIMAATKTAEQVKRINEIAGKMYSITERHLLATGIHYKIINPVQKKYKIAQDMLITSCVSNLIGLFIQGYDACRGVLSNGLLQVMDKNNLTKAGSADKSFIEKSIVETLRFDPPVQNTKRIAAENIFVSDIEIKKGESVLVVLAAANRDPKKFNHPGKYDIHRFNNNEHLTFGTGHHQCVARHFSVMMAVETLTYLFARYKNIRLLEKTIEYEPVINVRLPKKIMIELQ
ncbi:MAG: cytochrome P450 [Chitinophagaceae bacterium]